MSDSVEAQLVSYVRASPRLMRVLTIARALDLPDWLIASGAVFQTAWNALTGRDPDYGIKDFDFFYFDPDTSYEAEDAVIRRVAAAFPPDLSAMVEVRNQARVHLWFEGKFGEPYAPLSHSAEALTRFVSCANAVGVRLEEDDRLRIFAPFGLDDLMAMRVRPLPGKRASASFHRISAKMQERWPELTIDRAVA